MITIQQVWQNDGRIEGFSVFDSNNPDVILVTYIDYDLCYKLNKIIQFRNIPYSGKESSQWTFGKIIKTINENE